MLPQNERVLANLVPRVFLRHTVIPKRNEHPGTFRSHAPRSRCISSHYGFHGLLSNPNQRKVAVALALILQKINREIKNKHFKDPI